MSISEKSMKTNIQRMRRLVEGMRLAYDRGENAMAWARANEDLPDNTIDASLIALLDVYANPLNPSGVLLLAKSDLKPRMANDELPCRWQCPITGAELVDAGDLYYAQDVGLAYPVMRSIPLLRPEHAIVASLLGAVRVP
jgi:uncharacterized protein YbaR (Trm112 family)